MSTNSDESSELISFTAIWDEELGPEIVEFYPISNLGDYEKLAIQIFTVYQFFWDSPDEDYQRTNIVLPINRLDKKAKVIFDVIPNTEVRGGLQPFIVVLLVPSYITDEELDEFNETMLKFAQKFSRKEEIFLKDYYPEFKALFELIISLKETNDKISEYYSYTAAVDDFKAGIKLFQTKNYDQAYEILRNVLIKFEQEDHRHLIMEVLYIIASIFIQERKFKVAKEYFKRLDTLAEELHHDKYHEISLFMQGFSDYKTENFTSAIKSFKQVDILRAKFLNKIQFYTIYGRVLANLEIYEEAIQHLTKALTTSSEMEESDLIKKQKSQLLYELGILNYKIAVENLKSSGIKQKEYNIYLQEAVDFFKRTVELSIELNDSNALVQIYQFIGNIYEFLGKDLESLNYYEKAFEHTFKSNNLSKRIMILNRIIQKQTEQKKFENNIEKINDFLSNIEEYRFIDLFTVFNFRKQLANSLIAIDKKYEGLAEQLKALEILKSFKTPIYEEIELLNQIIEIFTEFQDYEKVAYYSEEIKKVSSELERVSVQKPKTYRPMGDVKEIWIFHSIAGVEMYDYAPLSKIDNDLLGGFLTAMRQFSVEISQKQLNDMIIGNDLYMIYSEEGYDFFILGRADVKISKSVIKTILSVIYRRFWKEYSNHIKKFQGNIKHFRGFTEIIESLDLTLAI